MGSCVSVNNNDGNGDDDDVVAVSGSVNEMRAICSNSFTTVGGRKWCLRFYPDGYTYDVRGYASVYLEALCRSHTVALAEFSIALINRISAAVHKVQCERPCRFDRRQRTWGIHKFISRQQLESAALGALHGESLTMRCTVHIIMERKNRAAGIVAVPVPPSCYAANAEKFLLSGDVPFDLEFHVGDATFKAHRMVVAAQSPYFRNLLYGMGKEASSPHVYIRERNPETFGAVLHYIYHDKLPDDVVSRSVDDDDNAAVARELFEAADMYLMERLKLMCADIMLRLIDDDNADGAREQKLN
ncbi:hypothetical protein GUJ93_ZPchr0004g40502 [Zizania palustris]|uniref:BTB/POZ domain containing protein n=1 Tax=Zizania palustris TaxID=103762 RepID=A0A8J5S2I2_ZIZPA|nr:hypothetical protein GUJ93_ZPchr0004g40502 [Zizania palustris]